MLAAQKVAGKGSSTTRVHAFSSIDDARQMRRFETGDAVTTEPLRYSCAIWWMPARS